MTDSTAIVVGAADMDTELSWTHGTLAFRDAPLSEVVSQLNRWYDIDLRLADTALAHRTVTGTFAGESCAEALSTLQSVMHLAIVVDSTHGNAPIITLIRRTGKQPSALTPRDVRTLIQNSTGVGR